MMKFRYKDIITTVVLWGLATPLLAHAAGFWDGVYSVTAGALGRVILIINYIVGFIGGIVFSLGGF